MVETISPAVHGGRRTGYWRSVSVHALGATAAGALLGLVLGALGNVMGAPWGVWGPAAVAAAALAYAAREGTGLGIPVLHSRTQVPEWWRTFFSPTTASLLYGLGLGTGFATYVSFGTLTVVAVAVVSSGSPAAGAAFFAIFGLARGLSVLAGSGSSDPERSGHVVDRLAEVGRTGLPRAANAVALTLVATGALASLAA